MQASAIRRPRRPSTLDVTTMLGLASSKTLSDLSFGLLLGFLGTQAGISSLSYLLFSLPACIASLAILAAAYLRPSIHLTACTVVSHLALLTLNMTAVVFPSPAMPPMAKMALVAACGMASIEGKVFWLACASRLESRPALVALSGGMALGISCELVAGWLPTRAARLLLCLVCMGAGALCLLHRHLVPDGRIQTGGQPSAPREQRIPTGLVGPAVVFLSFEFVFCLLNPLGLADEHMARDVTLTRGLLSVIALLGLAAIGSLSEKVPDTCLAFRSLCPAMAGALLVMPLLGHLFLVGIRALLAALISFVAVIALHVLVQRCALTGASPLAGASVIYLVSEAVSCLGIVVGSLVTAARGPSSPLSLAAISMLALVTALSLISRIGRNSFEAIAGEEGVIIERRLKSLRTIDRNEQSTSAEPSIRRQALESRLVRCLGLSERESQVVSRYLSGRSADRIAQDLGLETSTVRSYTKRIFSKLGIHSRQELIDLCNDLS